LFIYSFNIHLNIIFAFFLPTFVFGYITSGFVWKDLVWISHTPTSALCVSRLVVMDLFIVTTHGKRQ